MKRSLLLVLALALVNVSICVAADDAKEETDKQRKEKLERILSQLKTKATKVKAKAHDVSVPVASAGARGEQQQEGSHFAVAWPKSNVSPLTALSKNIRNAASQGRSWSVMKLQLLEFVDNYPEFKDEPLLKELEGLLDAATGPSGKKKAPAATKVDTEQNPQ